MKIKEVIAVLNQMEADRVIDRYALGGAVAATFYLEPIATLDVEVFVSLEPRPGESLIDHSRIFDYLKAHGHRLEGEHAVIAGWPVQFLPSTGPLVDEALAEAVTVEVESVPARVFSAEHLAAIALQTGRPKDKARLLQFTQAGRLDAARFEAILGRHRLLDQWRTFERQFLTDAT